MENPIVTFEMENGAIFKAELYPKIANVKTDFNDKPLEEIKIKKVTVDTKGVDYPEVEKM
ncbi:MAG: hypothetical protein E6Y10_01845 [Anaerococcus sp.]|nr:hypothetical protein [Anaerococcus sp.]